MAVQDPIIVLEMPGCILKEVNELADQHFQKRARVPLGAILSQGSNKLSFYDLLWNDTPPEEHCPLRKMYSELLREGEVSAKTLIALDYHKEEAPVRNYDVFLLHGKLAGEGLMSVRLMPFPKQWQLRIDRDSEAELASVEMQPILSNGTFSLDRLDQSLISSLLDHVWEMVKTDKELELAPANSDEDRDRYLRLHIPLEELEKQDKYIGWLPVEEPYQDIRDQVREEMIE